MGVLTGIIRVIKAGIFSDLNNLRTYTILSDDYTDSYGLTEEEVSKEALKQIEDKKYDISLKQNGIKEITYIGIAFCGKQIKISYKEKS